MKLSQSSTTLIEEAIKKAIAPYNTNENGSEQTVITDIHLQPNHESGKLSVYDDEDCEVANTFIEEWSNYKGPDFYKDVERSLTNLLNNLKQAGTFDRLTIMKPYSFVLIDNDKESIAELLLMDDDTLLASDELLKGLDEELDAFLKELLEK